LHGKPKFLLLVADNKSQEDDASKKHSVGAKEERVIGNKRAKQLKKIEDTAENLSTKLSIVKKEPTGDKHHHNGTVDDARMMIGRVLNDLASMARSGFESWQQSLLLEHASDSVKLQLADVQIKCQIRHLEKENMEKDATDVLMQLTSSGGHSSTSSLSSPETN